MLAAAVVVVVIGHDQLGSRATATDSFEMASSNDDDNSNNNKTATTKSVFLYFAGVDRIETYTAVCFVGNRRKIHVLCHGQHTLKLEFGAFVFGVQSEVFLIMFFALSLR